MVSSNLSGESEYVSIFLTFNAFLSSPHQNSHQEWHNSIPRSTRHSVSIQTTELPLKSTFHVSSLRLVKDRSTSLKNREQMGIFCVCMMMQKESELW